MVASKYLLSFLMFFSSPVILFSMDRGHSTCEMPEEIRQFFLQGASACVTQSGLAAKGVSVDLVFGKYTLLWSKIVTDLETNLREKFSIAADDALPCQDILVSLALATWKRYCMIPILDVLSIRKMVAEGHFQAGNVSLFICFPAHVGVERNSDQTITLTVNEEVFQLPRGIKYVI